MWRQTQRRQMCWFQSWQRWLWQCASIQFTSPCLPVRLLFDSHIQWPFYLCFRNCLLLCLCPACCHSPQCHRVWAQQHEDGRHDEGRLCDEPHLRHHPGRLHQQLCCPTLWAGWVPRLGPGCSSKCVALLPVKKKLKPIQRGMALIEMNEGCEVRRICWYSDSLNV